MILWNKFDNAPINLVWHRAIIVWHSVRIEVISQKSLLLLHDKASCLLHNRKKKSFFLWDEHACSCDRFRVYNQKKTITEVIQVPFLSFFCHLINVIAHCIHKMENRFCWKINWWKKILYTSSLLLFFFLLRTAFRFWFSQSVVC